MKTDNIQTQQPARRREIFRELPPNLQAQACLILSKHVVYELLSKMTNADVAEMLAHLDPDEATDVLQLFSTEKQKRLLAILDGEIRGAVEKLMRFDPSTAAGLMDIDYIQVNENENIAEVARQFKIHEKRTGRLPVIIVLKENGELLGYLPGHELGFARLKDKARKYVRKITTIPHSASRDETIEIFRSYPHAKMAVLGATGQVLGIIYSDDVLRLLREQESESLYDFAGVSEEESVFDGAAQKVKFRYKWLIINLATAFLASFVVSLFDATIAKYVLLAVYMPIIAGMGGNAATQTMAVMVRGITLKQIDLAAPFYTLKKEVLAGLVNGAINGLIVAAVVIALNRDVTIALVLAMAMVVNLVVAAFFGTLIPLFMKKIGKDPASSATIFITTATDVLGFLAFLGLATLLLP
ncbi:MAG: magnesium transporter [Candidatus Pacebacteria bacterium]|nr:magnesium transporter [Candidatus Paceibacterota bacterium]